MRTGFGGEVDVPGILEFIDSGRNVLLAASSEVSDTLRTIAAEVGVELDEKGTSVFDHMSGQGDPKLIASTELAKLSSFLGASDIKVGVLACLSLSAIIRHRVDAVHPRASAWVWVVSRCTNQTCNLVNVIVPRIC